MSIRQLNASYVPEEDRVMLRFTTDTQEEYRLWLTRAVVGTLLEQTQALAVQALEQQGNVHQAKEVAQFKQQALQQSATYTQFEGAARFPLGAEPVLVRTVQAQFRENSSVLVLALARGQNLTLTLSEDLVGKLQLLLQKMSEAGRWALGSSEAVYSSAPAQVAGKASEPADSPDTSTPPKVLH